MARKVVTLLQWSVPVLLLVALAGVPARAAARDARGGGVKQLETKRPIPQWGMGALFTVGCLAIAFKNSKRTHLD